VQINELSKSVDELDLHYYLGLVINSKALKKKIYCCQKIGKVTLRQAQGAGI